MGERPKPELPVITPYPARANASERQMRIGEMKNRIVDAAPAERNSFDNPLLELAAPRE